MLLADFARTKGAKDKKKRKKRILTEIAKTLGTTVGVGAGTGGLIGSGLTLAKIPKGLKDIEASHRKNIAMYEDIKKATERVGKNPDWVKKGLKNAEVARQFKLKKLFSPKTIGAGLAIGTGAGLYGGLGYLGYKGIKKVLKNRKKRKD